MATPNEALLEKMRAFQNIKQEKAGVSASSSQADARQKLMDKLKQKESKDAAAPSKIQQKASAAEPPKPVKRSAEAMEDDMDAVSEKPAKKKPTFRKPNPKFQQEKPKEVEVHRQQPRHDNNISPAERNRVLEAWYARKDKEDYLLRTNNPHIDQVFLDLDRTLSHPEAANNFCRILLPDAPEKEYRRRKGEKKTVLHWGQRKLLMAELEFITLYGKRDSKIVYAGAAPGTHVEYLSKLFPHCTFILIDPQEFTCHPSERIQIRRQYFTDKVALEFKDQDVLFISDIRTKSKTTGGSKYADNVQEEKNIAKDMKSQANWHKLMQPRKSMLKFRLPWKEHSGISFSRYLDGRLFLPVWGPVTTTETRLIPEGNAEKDWDNEKYERQMFYFNTSLRNMCFSHPIMESDGLDHCFDCTSEIIILRQYLILTRYREEIEQQQKATAEAMGEAAGPVAEMDASQLINESGLIHFDEVTQEVDDIVAIKVVEMSKEISIVLSKGNRILTDPQPEAFHRAANLAARPLQQ